MLPIPTIDCHGLNLLSGGIDPPAYGSQIASLPASLCKQPLFYSLLKLTIHHEQVLGDSCRVGFKNIEQPIHFNTNFKGTWVMLKCANL